MDVGHTVIRLDTRDVDGDGTDTGLAARLADALRGRLRTLACVTATSSSYGDSAKLYFRGRVAAADVEAALATPSVVAALSSVNPWRVVQDSGAVECRRGSVARAVEDAQGDGWGAGGSVFVMAERLARARRPAP